MQVVVPGTSEVDISQPRLAGLQLAPRALVEALERAFDGDGGARIFLLAALRLAHRATLPTAPEVLLDFVRAHMIGMLAEEVGALRATEFLDELTVTLKAMTPVEAPLEASDTGESDTDSSPRLRSRTSAPAPPSSADAVSDRDVPSSERAAARRQARLRTLLVHSDRFVRAALARHLLAARCDVVVVETFLELASILDVLPTVAVVDLAVRDLDMLLAGMVTRNPRLRVLALAGPEHDAGRLLERARVRVSTSLPHAAPGPEVAVALRRLAMVAREPGS